MEETSGSMHSERNVTCGNCLQAVSQQNWPLHEARCGRINALCPHCGSAVLRADLEGHREQCRRTEPCAQCGAEVEVRKMEQHLSEVCDKMLVECGYCRLQLVLSDISQHEEYCGSQTEPCGDCQRLIRRRDVLPHLSVCDRVPVVAEPSSSDGAVMYDSDRYGPANDLTCRSACALLCCSLFCCPCLMCCWRKCQFKALDAL